MAKVIIWSEYKRQTLATILGNGIQMTDSLVFKNKISCHAHRQVLEVLYYLVWTWLIWLRKWSSACEKAITWYKRRCTMDTFCNRLLQLCGKGINYNGNLTGLFCKKNLILFTSLIGSLTIKPFVHYVMLLYRSVISRLNTTPNQRRPHEVSHSNSWGYVAGSFSRMRISLTAWIVIWLVDAYSLKWLA